MSSFAVEVVRLDDVLPHENAERLELAVIGGYRAVVQKGIHRKDDLVVYVPEDSILPDDVLDAFGFTGKLAGSKKNRVKAVRLRGELSQGLVIRLRVVMDFLTATGRVPALENFYEGLDVTALLGIEKYEEPIPVEMAGKVRRRPEWFPRYTDIENIKKFNRTLVEGEQVIITEKIHGTNFSAGMTAADLAEVNLTDLEALHVASRNNVLEPEASNLYWRAALTHDLARVLARFLTLTSAQSVVMYGEVFGAGVQDLTYGGKPGEVHLRWFDVMLDGKFLNYETATEIMEQIPDADIIEHVPILYVGPFSQAVVEHYTNGKDTISESHVREGIVIKPVVEREGGRNLKRVILKSVSAEYLLRKGGTERH